MTATSPDLWGIGAGLMTAALWSATSMIFEAASRRLGSLRLNFVRLVFALVFFMGLSLYRWGTVLPPGLDAGHWIWLGLSGLVGFVLGDLCLFEAFVLIGAPLSMLVYSSVPFMAALLGWAFLGENLGWQSLEGMVLCVGGIVLAIWRGGETRDAHHGGGGPGLAVNGAVPAGEGRGSPAMDGEVPACTSAGSSSGRQSPALRAATPARTGKHTLGIVLALAGALAQALGLILSRFGQGSLDAFSATEIRVLPGIAGFGILWLVMARFRPSSGLLDGRLRDGKGISLALAGALVGPFLGVSLGLLSAQRIGAGMASTLMALVPIFLVAVSLVRPGTRGRPGAREIAGAILAVAGVAVMSV